MSNPNKFYDLSIGDFFKFSSNSLDVYLKITRRCYRTPSGHVIRIHSNDDGEVFRVASKVETSKVFWW